MHERDVVELYGHLQTHGVDVIIDGGWGVDALLGRQSRQHADLDVAVPHEQVGRLRALLAARGFGPLARPGTSEWNFVLGDGSGRQVDVHSFSFDPPLDLDHDVAEVPDDRSVTGVDYPRRSLYGSGVIGGTAVRCIVAEYLVSFHRGYPLDEDDYRDVLALCVAFDLDMPAEYESFARERP